MAAGLKARGSATGAIGFEETVRDFLADVAFRFVEAGRGRFVHAEDYGTGVVVSSVLGGYWGRHYAGARRPY